MLICGHAHTSLRDNNSDNSRIPRHVPSHDKRILSNKKTFQNPIQKQKWCDLPTTPKMDPDWLYECHYTAYHLKSQAVHISVLWHTSQSTFQPTAPRIRLRTPEWSRQEHCGKHTNTGCTVLHSSKHLVYWSLSIILWTNSDTFCLPTDMLSREVQSRKLFAKLLTTVMFWANKNKTLKS